MSRRSLLGAAAASAAVARLGAAIPGRRPNILLILADDWSWQPEDDKDRLIDHLPTFARIVREGTSFRNAFSASPSCTASRGGILTGQWPWRLAEGANLASILPRRFKVYPDLLEGAGYHVGYARKGWGPGQIEPARRTRNPAGNAFADFDAFMGARPKDAPFCFWFGSHDPHRPYVKGAGVAAGIDPTRVTVPPYLPDTPTVRSDIVDYRFEVERIDREAGELLAKLTAMGELDNTLVVMTGDNGWPFPRGKATLYDAGWHVPLAIMGPGVRAGAASEVPVSLIDLAPTFLRVGGVAAPAETTGRDLVPLLSGAAHFGRDHVLGSMERHMDGRTHPGEGYPMRAYRTARHLYIRNFKPDRWPAGDPSGHPRSRAEIEAGSFGGFADIDGGPAKADMILRQDEPAVHPAFELATGKRPAEELFDLSTDPWCLTNLALDPKHRALLRSLGTKLDADLRATGDPRVLGNGDVFDDYPSYSDPGYGRPKEL